MPRRNDEVVVIQVFFLKRVMPYLDTVGSEWLLELSRQRAVANWLAKGSAGIPGQTSQSMCCGAMDHPWEDPHICPNTTAGRYPGFEFTTHFGPLLEFFGSSGRRVHGGKRGGGGEGVRRN